MVAMLPVILTSAHLVLASQEVPRLNVVPSCAAAASTGVLPHANEAACLRDEQQARAKLKRQWSDFSASEQQRCVQLNGLGGQPSYVELLTCLQLAKEAKNLPAEGEATVGLGG
jgi:hypothetical protein